MGKTCLTSVAPNSGCREDIHKLRSHNVKTSIVSKRCRKYFLKIQYQRKQGSDLVIQNSFRVIVTCENDQYHSFPFQQTQLKNTEEQPNYCNSRLFNKSANK